MRRHESLVEARGDSFTRVPTLDLHTAVQIGDVLVRHETTLDKAISTEIF